MSQSQRIMRANSEWVRVREYASVSELEQLQNLIQVDWKLAQCSCTYRNPSLLGHVSYSKVLRNPRFRTCDKGYRIFSKIKTDTCNKTWVVKAFSAPYRQFSLTMQLKRERRCKMMTNTLAYMQVKYFCENVIGVFRSFKFLKEDVCL